MKIVILLIATLTLQTTSLQALQLSKYKKSSVPQPQIIPLHQQQLNDALYEASIYGEIDKVLEQLSAGASPDATCPIAFEWHPHAMRGATALMSAANRGNFEMCQVLLMGNAKPEIRDYQGRNALLHAGIKRNLEIFFLLLANTQADDKAFDDLYHLRRFVKKYASEESHRLALRSYADSVCQRCMKEKVQFIRTDSAGMHLLHYVAAWSSPEVCNQLIQHLRSREISLSPTNKKNKTPLHLMEEESQENCRLLIINKADINAFAIEKEEGIRTPLDYAINDEKYGIATIFIEYGAHCHPQLAVYTNYPMQRKLIYAPALDERSASKQRILTSLLCFKRYCPQLPRDLRNLLLNLISPQDIGEYMIDRKLNGFSIPQQFFSNTLMVLCDQTFHELKLAGIKMDKQDLKENIEKRLAMQKLQVNNPQKW